MAFPEFPTNNDVERLMRHQYSPEEYDEVASLLEPVSHSGHFGWTPARIRLAALVLSDGNKALISQWIEQGNLDCRDLQLIAGKALGFNWEREFLTEIDPT